MNKIRPENNRSGVVYTAFHDGIASITANDITTEREIASELDTKRARICFHQDRNDLVHEMMITFHRDTYVRPHKHLAKAESYLVIEGEMEILYFDDNGHVTNRIEMGNFESGKQFYLKSITEAWHTPIIKSEFVTLLEITNGPFVENDCLFADWAPELGDKVGIRSFFEKYS